jgi:hypothetical protein
MEPALVSFVDTNFIRFAWLVVHGFIQSTRLRVQVMKLKSLDATMDREA